MIKKIFLSLTCVVALVACTEDYKDWTTPAKVEQPAAATFTDGAVATTGVSINLNTLPAGQDSVQVVNITTAPTASDAAYAPVYTINLGDFEYGVDATGRMAAADLQEYIAQTFGRNPNILRTFNATLNMWVSNGGTNVKTGTSAPFQIQAYAKAPFIEQKYYITGNINGWNNGNTDYELTNDGSSPYDNPTFTCRIPVTEKALEDKKIEFKATPQSKIGTGDWSGCLGSAETEGQFEYENQGGNFVIEIEEGAKFYDLTFKMLEQTWEAKAVKFGEFIYEIGNSHGWSSSMPLRSPSFDGKYQGYYYLDGGFKFKPNADNWDGDWGQDPNGEEGKLVQEGEKDCNAAAGFYQIDVDLSAMKWSITKVNSISIIGTVNGNWNNDTDLTYNKETGAWEATTALSAGAMKFRMNHDWTISWGGANGDPTAFDNLTQNNGKDLTLAEAGTYKVQLYIAYEGNNKVVVTKQ